MAILTRTAGQLPSLPGSVTAKGLVYTSGLVDPAAMGQDPPPFADQAAAAMTLLLATLTAAGTDAAHVVKLEAFLADAADFAAWNTEFAKVWPEPGPARTTLVAVFALPTVRFEVQAVAVLP